MQSKQLEKMLLLWLSDMAAMLLAFGLALFLGHQPPFTFGLFFRYDWGLLTMVVSVVLILFILDAYSLRKLPEIYLHQIPILVIGLASSALVVSLIFFFFRNPVPRAVFLLFYCFSAVLIVAFRLVSHRRALSSVYWKVLIVGSYERSREVARLIKARKYLHSRVVGYVFDAPGGDGEEVPHLGDHFDLVQLVDRHNINHVILAGHYLSESAMRSLLKCMQKKIKVSDFRKMIEDITGKVPIEHLTDNWFVVQLSDTDKRYFWYCKRSYDIVVSLFGLLLALPILALAALLIKLDSKGRVLYSQQRIGRGNVPFRVWKLRTMVTDADKNNVHWTLDKDDRITRVGRLLRKMHIDELPQLYNILTGEMSLIGPRPEAARLVELYTREIPYYVERHMVTPGITGWAQINHPYGNSIDDTCEKLRYDFYYIKNRSIALDLTIFLRTIRTVLTGNGAL